MSKEWNWHEHRDEVLISTNNSLYALGYGQLCYGEKHHDCILWFPVLFKTKAAAEDFRLKGCTAKIQEGLSNLLVDFVKETVVFDWRTLQNFRTSCHDPKRADIPEERDFRTYE